MLLTVLPLALFVPSTLGIDPSVVFLIAAAVFLSLGAADGRLRQPGGLQRETAGMLAFGATGLAALYAAPELGTYLVAFALLGHADWDAYHYLRNRVVTRS